MDDAIASVRAFNRFFTRHVGVWNPDFLGANMTLVEARLLFEIAQGDGAVASDLQAALDMDAGFASRMLRRLEARHWIVRTRSQGDGRRRPIALTAEGRAVFEDLDRRQRGQVQAVLDRLSPSQRNDLAAALSTARLLMGDRTSRAFTLRTFRPGDVGMIAARQAILYGEVYGWGPQIEVIEAEVVAAFIRGFKPGREQCWVAEIDGAMVGSIFLTDEEEGLSRLRLLYVEPTARGLGVGDALVSTCIAFARGVGYRAITLWTHTVLESARRIYAAHGFNIVEVHIHDQFGEPEQSETWRLDMA